jgi:hypothetical protein
MMKLQSSIGFLVMMTLILTVTPLQTTLQGQQNHGNLATLSLHRVLARELEDYTGLCANEVNTADSCGITAGCTDCFVLALKTIPKQYDTCKDFRDSVCSELEQCQASCGICYEKVADLVDCAFSNNQGVDQCNINCSSVSGRVSLDAIMALVALSGLFLLV